MRKIPEWIIIFEYTGNIYGICNISFPFQFLRKEVRIPETNKYT